MSRLPKDKIKIMPNPATNKFEGMNVEDDIKYNKDVQTFVQSGTGKRGPLTDFKLAETGIEAKEVMFGDPETWDMKVGEFIEQRAKNRKTDKPFENVIDNLQNRGKPKNKINNRRKPNNMDILYSASTPREKAEMRKRYKDYDFIKKAFKEDLKKVATLSAPPMTFSPLPVYSKAKELQKIQEPKPQPMPKPEGIAQVLTSAPPKETGGLNQIIDDAVFRLKNPWINKEIESIERITNKIDGGNND